MPSSEEGRSPKRRKSSNAAAIIQPASLNSISRMATAVDNVIDIFVDGDLVLQLNGMAGMQKPIGLRVSSHVLAMTSPVFKALLATVTDRSIFDTSLPLPDDDGDALLLLCNILHLRNDALPSRLPPQLLDKVAALANKYQCATAAGRATMTWFDRLLSLPVGSPGPDTWKMIQAAYLLDEPVSFARFTQRWVLDEGMGTRIPVAEIADGDTAMKRLAVDLHNRRQALISTVRADIDLVVDPCSLAFSKTTEHYIDYMPGMTPDTDDDTGRIPGGLCYVDSQAGILYLGAIRDNGIWPPTVWSSTLGQVVQNMREFKAPAYDDCDKCEFCEDVKAKFGIAVDLVKRMQGDRLWGLCLDCFKAGGVALSECRYEHTKPGRLIEQQCG